MLVSHNALHSSRWGERERVPTCGLNGCAVPIDKNYVTVFVRPGHAALRANVASRIGNRVSPAESAFSAAPREAMLKHQAKVRKCQDRLWEATEAPTPLSRSPLLLTEATQ